MVWVFFGHITFIDWFTCILFQVKPAVRRPTHHRPFTSTQDISESDDSMDDVDDGDLNDSTPYPDRHGM